MSKIFNRDVRIWWGWELYVWEVRVIDSDWNVDAPVTSTDLTLSGSCTVWTTLAVTWASTLTWWATIGWALIQGWTWAITATSWAWAIAVTWQIHEVTTTWTWDAMTLANWTAGQRLTVLYVAEWAWGDTAVITPTTLAGWSTITLNNLWDSADLQYSATWGWYVLGLWWAAAVA